MTKIFTGMPSNRHCLVGPLPETPDSVGKKYICTVTAYHTKWAEATALPSKQAVRVVNFLYKVKANA